MKPTEKLMLRCKDLGHEWEETVNIYRKDPEWGKRRELLCVNCGSARLELLNVYGEVGSRHYEFSEAYKQHISTMTKKEARAKRIFNGKAKTPAQIKARDARAKIIDSTR